jgi:hypothetical protein
VNAPVSTSERIRELNDAFRASGPTAGGWMLTCGVQALGTDFVVLATKAVQQHSRFTANSDPYGEHDFGSFNLGGEHLFWKIDHYDRELAFGSEDPSNPAVTRRIMTIMLASEY